MLELTDQAREKAKPYTDKAMEKAKETGDQAKQAAERAGEAAKPYVEKTKEAAQKAYDEALRWQGADRQGEARARTEEELSAGLARLADGTSILLASAARRGLAVRP